MERRTLFDWIAEVGARRVADAIGMHKTTVWRMDRGLLQVSVEVAETAERALAREGVPFDFNETIHESRRRVAEARATRRRTATG